jgi:hypothetical protein
MKNLLKIIGLLIVANACITLLVLKMDYFKSFVENIDNIHSLNDFHLILLPYLLFFMLFSGIFISIGLILNKPQIYFKAVIDGLKHTLLVCILIVFVVTFIAHLVFNITLPFVLFLTLSLIIVAGILILILLMLSIDEAWQ